MRAKPVIALLVLCLAAETAFLARGWLRVHSMDFNLSQIDPNAPRAREVAQIIQPLRYSGLQTLLRPDIGLSIDPRNGIWTLTHFFLFDSQGQALLEEGVYGVCGSLSAAIYPEIKRLLDPGLYDVKFVRVSESGFFPPPNGTHFILKITERGPVGIAGQTYILDAAFLRYGKIEEFTDYFFQEEMDLLPFMEFRSPHLGLEVNTAIPIEIRNNRILSLSLRDAGGTFDAKNFRLVLRVRQRYHFTGIKAFEIQITEGASAISVEDRNLIRQVLSDEEYARLRERLIRLAEGVQEHRHDAPNPLSWRSKEIGFKNQE